MQSQVDFSLAPSAHLPSGQAGIGHRRICGVVAGMAGCTLLGACAAPLPAPPAHDSIIWSAAIGRLDDEKDDSSCSATLVAPDVIATAAHCVIIDGRTADVSSLTFRPNLGASALPPAQGVEILAIGTDAKTPQLDHGNDLDVSTDWALVRVAPAVTTVTPITVGKFTPVEIDDALAAGGDLLQAGYVAYGLSAGQHLYQQGHCRRLSTDALPARSRDYVLLTSCRPSKGDSGGPLILTKATGERYLVGVISGWDHLDSSPDRVTLASSALGFAHNIGSNP